MQSARPDFLDPKQSDPPLGRKVLLLTRYGVCRVGEWIEEDRNLGWLPLPNVPTEMKKRIGS